MPKKLAATADPTIPAVELQIGKDRYYLAFTFRALAIAQKSLRDVGVQCNLLHALDLSNLDAEKLVSLLFAALITHQPKITPEQVADLVTFRNMGLIFEKLAEAYGASLADPTTNEAGTEDAKPDPTQAE